MCELVTAYKAKDGSLHTSENGCRQANQRYEERLRAEADAKRATQALAVFKEGSRYNPYTGMYYNETAFREDRAMDYILEVLKKNWREVRDGLNRIKE